MVTAESVKARLRGLIRQANDITGKQDTDLTTAVGSLAAGFGQGGADSAVEDALIERSLTEYTNDRVTTIGAYAFYLFSGLKSVSFPNVTSFLGGNNFNGCGDLEQINFPKLEGTGSNAFHNCRSLREAILPRCVIMPRFSSCGALTKVALGRDNRTATQSRLAANCLNGASSLVCVILYRENGVVTLSDVNAFANTPFAVGGTGGTVYVPEALIGEYQEATNWSTLYAAGSCQFVAIEGSGYE